ncbi:cell envelope-related transcriptional attenuator [Candidatus Termititenax persephonae]|uniref:Cell envelope-related transcriptional attenuator n=1 Tax=Candidatus Termititenax persephonae TaxID=2218525 RepID=A0A388TIP8_9BACT|nr:cell envelope-related transcriptional attenuator [Candidatus Termititenax persephonae]
MFNGKQKKILIIIAFVSIVGGLAGLLISFNAQSFGTLLKLCLMTMPQRHLSDNTTVLIMGVDNSADKMRRADTIMVANLNPFTKYIGVLSIPRDCRIPVPGHGQTKINHAYAYGGQKLLREAVSNYLQTPIHYYIEMDVNGLVTLVDQIGGVPINVEKRMYYVDYAGDLFIDLQPGQQVLNGEKAMQYVRFRNDAMVDLGRIERQHKFMRAFANRLLNISVIFKAPTVIFKMAKFVRTNIPAARLGDLAARLKEAYQLGHLEIVTIPSTPVTIDGVAYMQPDWNRTQALVQKVIRGYEFYTPALPPLRKPPELAVEVLNGSGITGLGKNMADKLKHLRYQVWDTKDAGRSDYSETILINWHGQDLADEALILARKLYLSPGNIITRQPQDKDTPLSFSLIVGSDWPIER